MLKKNVAFLPSREERGAVAAVTSHARPRGVDFYTRGTRQRESSSTVVDVLQHPSQVLILPTFPNQCVCLPFQANRPADAEWAAPGSSGHRGRDQEQPVRLPLSQKAHSNATQNKHTVINERFKHICS